MGAVFDVVRYLAYGLLAIVGLLVVIAVLFGKRVRKQWEFEADFLDADGRSFGEYEIELSRIQKEEPDYTLKSRFRMRHASLEPNLTVEVYIGDALVLEETVEDAGRVHARGRLPLAPVDKPTAGEVCRVVVGGAEIAAAELHPDRAI